MQLNILLLLLLLLFLYCDIDIENNCNAGEERERIIVLIVVPLSYHAVFCRTNTERKTCVSETYYIRGLQWWRAGGSVMTV